MKTFGCLLVAAAGLAAQCAGTASAAPATLGSIVTKVGNAIDRLPGPAGHTLGSTSLATISTLPVLNKINLPGLGAGGLGAIPVVGQLPLSQALVLVESLAPLQRPLLPGPKH